MAFMAGDDFRPQILASASRRKGPSPVAICTETSQGMRIRAASSGPGQKAKGFSQLPLRSQRAERDCGKAYGQRRNRTLDQPAQRHQSP